MLAKAHSNSVFSHKPRKPQRNDSMTTQLVEVAVIKNDCPVLVPESNYKIGDEDLIKEQPFYCSLLDRWSMVPDYLKETRFETIKERQNGVEIHKIIEVLNEKVGWKKNREIRLYRHILDDARDVLSAVGNDGYIIILQITVLGTCVADSEFQHK